MRRSAFVQTSNEKVGAVAGAIAIAVVAASSPALADERKTAVSVGGGLVAQEPDEDAAWGGRLALSWERPRLAMPDTPGYAIDGTIVPELVGGTQHLPDRIESLIGIGVRAELRVSQREMGLLRVSARAGFYVAGRAFVVGKTRDPQLEAVLGEYFYLGKNSGTRFGIEAGYFERRIDPMIVDWRPERGLVAQIYVGFGM